MSRTSNKNSSELTRLFKPESIAFVGVAAEALNVVAMRLAPIRHSEAQEMMAELRCVELLNGWRGGEPVDHDALVEALVKLSQLVIQNRWVSEMDLNPVRANANGVMILDALLCS